MPKTPKLTEKEARIMSLLWEHGPMFVREMLTHYDEPRPHFNTVSKTKATSTTKPWAHPTATVPWPRPPLSANAHSRRS